MHSDGELLRRYCDEGSEEAFATLVQRHINLVYRAALRRVGGDAHSADDVVQKVFTALARKAATLCDRPNLAGWLYTGTRFAAGEIVRAEKRRRAQEQEAHTMHELEARSDIPGERLDPVLDEVMDLLAERDRDAVLLHFFEGLPFHEVGEMLSLSADATRMRVNRALDRLRVELAHRGVASTAVALATVLSAQSGFSAPATLASAVVRHALVPAMPTSAAATWTVRLLRAVKSSPGLSSVGAVVVVGAIAFVALRSPPPPAPVVTSPNVVAVASAPDSDVQTELVALDPSPAGPAAAAARASVAAPPANSSARTVPRSNAGVNEFELLSPEEKGLLKQLWAIQDYYGETPGRTFAFNVGAANPRFAEFARGRELLQVRGWVNTGRSGGAMLTDLGRAFSEAHATEINGYPILFKEPDGAIAPRPNSAFANLSKSEKAILKKLWSMEATGKSAPGRQVGLNVSPTSPGFENFGEGRDSLVAKGFIRVGVQKGAVFLLPAGREFCTEHQDEIAFQPRPGAVAAPR